MIGELRKMEFAVPDSATNFILAQSIQMPREKVFKLLAERDIYVRYFKLPAWKINADYDRNTATE